ncbi:GH25 family lysozyme [Mesorhizobium sp.]|uniref:glycoside hydrolase family 25 protein n=1 Tax=Mesorhizobium sp. TaxID=1871066 RepID=UPI000FE8786B|nr:GH25 family lysozyme [Mesorhizobium sp.]RWK31075.1 MAG: muramidase [Mesorhizobium sp.]RWK69198.1 MAG: muramidase [Mesorhizobium sp.]RWK74092.1 MAG: muramidase [Mesorhizobium sp.]RWK74710.1 MAG: muramidase [Mesorhizobium sp.]RWL04684.1 MAG: muramidase [Mesorhizobium sp.]
MTMALAPAQASDFSEPWKNTDRALVIDAYEYNPIDWTELATDKRIVGFINKASDGMPPAYFCFGDETATRLCKALWKRHAVAQELFQTRKVVAKALGLKWGAYHLARPGNPVGQANNFINFAKPGPDDLLALDIEDDDPTKWMSLEDAEEFVRHVHRRIGRFPVLYTNGKTAKHIADNKYKYRLLSRLPLWYARYKPNIGVHFPMGNWQGYALWQFSAKANCGRFRCPYRVAGTPNDIDVNVAPMDAAALRAQWPFGGLIDAQPDYLASIPLPLSRAAGLAGNVTLTYATVAPPPSVTEMVAMFRAGWAKFRGSLQMPAVGTALRLPRRIADYLGWLPKEKPSASAVEAVPTDAVSTASTELDRSSLPR